MAWCGEGELSSGHHQERFQHRWRAARSAFHLSTCVSYHSPQPAREASVARVETKGVFWGQTTSDSETDRQFGRKTHSEQLGCCATPTTLQMQRLTSEEAPPKRLREDAPTGRNEDLAREALRGLRAYRGVKQRGRSSSPP